MVNRSKVNLTFQGGLVKAHHASLVPASDGRLGGGIRGFIRSFSRSSRKRLIEVVSRLAPRLSGGQPAVFITLTYPAQYPEANVAKKHLQAFRKRLARKFNIKPAALWRLEFQKRGAPHFHLLFFNLPYLPKRDLQVMWAEIIGDETKTVFTRIERISSRKHASRYISKYVAKMPGQDVSDDEFMLSMAHELGGVWDQSSTSVDTRGVNPFAGSGDIGSASPGVAVSSDGGRGASSGFNYASYLSADVGRFWGCWHKELFPFAELVALTVEFEPKIFHNFRRLAHQVFSGFRISGNSHGFTLFVDNSQRWLDYFNYLSV